MLLSNDQFARVWCGEARRCEVIVFVCDLHNRFDGWCCCALSGCICLCLGLVVEMMFAICLFKSDGYAVAADVDALPCVEELTEGGFPHFVDVVPFHCAYVEDFSL
jgi:hypothetical protein